MTASIFERKEMISFDEFKAYLFQCVISFLSGFPKEEVQAYLDSDAPEFVEIEKVYNDCVKRFKVSTLEHPNEVFSAGLSRLTNLLTLCFE